MHMYSPSPLNSQPCLLALTLLKIFSFRCKKNNFFPKLFFHKMKFIVIHFFQIIQIDITYKSFLMVEMVERKLKYKIIAHKAAAFKRKPLRYTRSTIPIFWRIITQKNCTVFFCDNFVSDLNHQKINACDCFSICDIVAILCLLEKFFVAGCSHWKKRPFNSITIRGRN